MIMKYRMKKVAFIEKTVDYEFPKSLVQKYYYKYSWALLPVAGLLIYHPLQVIGMHVIYSRFNRNYEMKNCFSNSAKASSMIPRVFGLRGFYRGFVPAALMTGII
jgi:hypothetical protein